MAGRINLVPKGLLGLLDLKTVGENPGILSDVVSATLDMGPFYNFAKMERKYAETASPALNTIREWYDGGTGGPELRTPPNEAWLLLRFSGYFNPPIATGETMTGAVGYRDVDTQNLYQILCTQFMDASGGNLVGLGAVSNEDNRGLFCVRDLPTIIPPGQEFFFWFANTVDAGGGSLSGGLIANLEFVRLPV